MGEVGYDKLAVREGRPLIDAIPDKPRFVAMILPELHTAGRTTLELKFFLIPQVWGVCVPHLLHVQLPAVGGAHDTIVVFDIRHESAVLVATTITACSIDPATVFAK